MNVAEMVLRGKADIDQVHEAGNQAEYDRFWNVYQQNGTRTNYSYAFAGESWTDETLNPKYLPIGTNMNGTFYYNSGITKTPPMRVHSWTAYNSTFYECKNLAELGEITGTIGRNISFAQSPNLKPESMIMVIDRLSDYSGTADASKYKVTFHATAWANLEAHSTAPNGGTWKDYVTAKGWLYG